MTVIELPLALIAAFFWTGFLSAISFMESWLKFRAPGVTLPIGLGIGRLVFRALNRMEWVLAIIILTSIIFSPGTVFSFTHTAFFLPVLLLFVQTIWLLPMLDARAELYIKQKPAPRSRLHYYFIGIELIKVISLCIFGISLFKTI